MSTEILSMQSFGSHSLSDFKPYFGMSTEMSQLYATPNAWGTIQPSNEFPSPNQYMTYAMPVLANESNPQFTFGAFSGSTQSDGPTQFSSQPRFKAANVVTYNQNVPSPVQASSRLNESSPIARNSSTVGPSHLDATQDDTSWAACNSEQNDYSLNKRRAKVGRKRKMEEAEPDSERAIYLEKNRKAASKCRSKQKQQQEDLVEEAREVQVRNKCLKAEVDLLQRTLRDFMECAGHHSTCSDSRLAVYLQRKADQLASASTRTSATPFSPTSSMHTSFTRKVESSPEDHATSYD